ncbi:hypothetical protein DFH07DRAFT_786455 [Mycena maculata]|uniref:Uncharacterized protein n=1 Tax=Mycena maculata TaxID=230809 RepID=A0AAD7P1W2_9AGAR|nr:hypothetical protein DFH07DRAFT_786455 [Mycena maculata]
MSHPTEKDPFLALGIYRAPHGMSQQEFDARMESFLGAMGALSVVQESLLKLEMMSANNLFDEHIKRFGMPASAPHPTTVFKAVSETLEHMLQVYRDPQVRKLLEAAGEFSHPRGASFFSVDVLEKMKKSGGQDSIHVIGLFQPPLHLTKEQYARKFDALVDSIVAHPTIQQNLLGYTAWVPNNIMDTSLKDLGISAVEPPFIILLESENWDLMMEVARDVEVQKIIAGGNEDFGFHSDSSSFAVDIVTKFERE